MHSTPGNDLAGNEASWAVRSGGQVALATQSPIEKGTIEQRQEGGEGGEWGALISPAEATVLKSRNRESQHIGRTAASSWGPVWVAGRTLDLTEAGSRGFRQEARSLAKWDGNTSEGVGTLEWDTPCKETSPGL